MGLRNQAQELREKTRSPAFQTERALDRVGVNVPPVVAPVHAHGTKDTGDVFDVEDVDVAIGQKIALFPIRLLGEQIPELGERGFCFLLATEFCNDRSVSGVLLEIAEAKFPLVLRFFDLSIAFEIPLREVAPDSVEFHFCGIRSELVLRSEGFGGGGGCNGTLQL